MKKAVQRFLPSGSNSSNSFKKSLKIDAINLIQDYFIDLDEPHKTWSPGEEITGVVVLDLKKNVVDVNITLTLVGYIKIKQGPNTANVRNKPVVLFRHTSTIYGFDPNDSATAGHLQTDEPTSGLSRGEHRFPFSMKLPKKNIYTSISFEKGAISYSLRASINYNNSTSPDSSSDASPLSQTSESTLSMISPHPKNPIQHCDKDLNIVVPINVAKIPKPQTKQAYLRISDKRLFKTISSTSTINSQLTQSSVNSENSNDSGSNVQASSITPKEPAIVKLSVDLPQSGFLRGELVPIKIKVSHFKPLQSSAGIIVTLMRLCRVDNGPETPIQTFRKDLSQTIAPLYIDPEALSGEVSTSLRIPADAFPTIVGSDIVSFQYYVEILANLSQRNIMRTSSGQTPKKGNQKFSHSIVFDLEQQPDHNTNEEGMVNVDVLKRTKNLLGLNTEIIIGTERTFKKKSATMKRSTHTTSTTVQQSQNNIVHQNGTQGAVGQYMMDSISQSSISPISMNDGVANPASATTATVSFANTAGVSTGHEIPSPEFQSNLSEKEILRLKEEALLPSEPTGYDESSPAPRYIMSSQATEYSAPPIRHFDYHDSTPSYGVDKAEAERRRLLELESEPPEFDYVPEYSRNHTDSEATTTASITSIPPMPTAHESLRS